MQWIDAAAAKPKALEPVVACYTENGRQLWARAVWVPKFFKEDDGTFQGDTDYHEGSDTNYWPKGWYEWNWCDETHWLLPEEVTQWASVELPSNAPVQRRSQSVRCDGLLGCDGGSERT